MNLVEYTLTLLLVGAFILLVAILFLVWFSRFSEKPTRFFLPAVTPNPQADPASFEARNRAEIFEPQEIKITQHRNPIDQQISERGEINQKSVARNSVKRFYFTESNIWEMLEVIRFVVIFSLATGIPLLACYLCVRFREYLPSPIQHICCIFLIFEHFYPQICKRVCKCGDNQVDNV